MEYDVGLTKILGSNVLRSPRLFSPCPPKITEITFSFPEFPTACKKSVHSINSFLRYSQF